MRATTDIDVTSLRSLMRSYAVLLGLSEGEAEKLADTIAGAAERPLNERQALVQIERAVLDPVDRDSADKALLATWLEAKDVRPDPAGLPQGGPPVRGLPMPAQNLDPVGLQDIARSIGLAARPRIENAVRSAVRGDL